MIVTILEKDKNAILDYKIDFSKWLPDGDTIQTAVWNVPTGLSKVSESHTATTAIVWLGGGALKTTYKVSVRITTLQGRQDDRTLTFTIVDQ